MIQKESKSLDVFKNAHASKSQEIKGPKDVSVAVLGAFDTWVFMHEISVMLAQLGYTARTSLYTYITKDAAIQGYFRERNPDSEEPMTKYLKENLLEGSDKAVIVYTVPAAHYNEAEWLYKLKKETLGIALVRNIIGFDFCEDYVVDFELGYGYCFSKENAWECIKKNPCPFKNQEISKNQLEYYTILSEDKMKLICIDKLSNLKKILDRYFSNVLMFPLKYPYIYEFRYPLTFEEHNKFIIMLNNIIAPSEECLFEQYSYEDLYYIPNNIIESEWVKGDNTIRIRRSLDTSSGKVNVIKSKIERDNNGFITKYPFGGKSIWKINNNEAKEFLKDMSMKQFLKIRKEEGVKYTLNNPIVCNVYVEKIYKEDKSTSIDLGYYAEIEFWVDNPGNKKLIIENTNKIIEFLKIDKSKLISNPVQELFLNINFTS